MSSNAVRAAALVCALVIPACARPDAVDVTRPHWALAPELRIGAIDGGEDALSEITDIAIGPDGAVYVAQPRDRTIKVFDSTGRFIRRTGRGGRGPGEFNWPSRISWLGDTLVVIDAGLRRVSFFDAGGESVADQPLIVPATGPYLRSSSPVALLPGGRAVGIPTYALDDVESGNVTSRPVVTLDRTGSILDTLAIFSIPPVFVIQRGNSSYQGGQPFRPTPLVRIGPDGRHVYLVDFPEVTGDGEVGLALTIVDASGDTVSSDVHSFAAVPVPGAAGDSVFDAVAGVLTRGDASPFTAASAGQAAREAISIPAVYPAADAAFVDAEGRLWVRTPVQRDGLVTWEVLGPGGERTASVSVPAAANLRHARAGVAWGIELDELDVPYVVRYRITVR